MRPGSKRATMKPSRSSASAAPPGPVRRRERAVAHHPHDPGRHQALRKEPPGSPSLPGYHDEPRSAAFHVPVPRGVTRREHSKSWGEVIMLWLSSTCGHRWRAGSRGGDGGTRLRACRSAPPSARRGRAARSPCCNASAAWFKKCHFQVALVGFRGGDGSVMPPRLR